MTNNINYQDQFFIDLSMFEKIDWTLFNPSTYLKRRDKRFNGSWVRYIRSLKSLKINDKTELKHVEACKSFEQKNKLSVGIINYFLDDRLIQFLVKKNKKRIFD